MAKYATEGNISHLSTLIIGWVKGLFSSANPLMDGTVAAGTSYKIAREDHVHPTDTSRAPYTPDETAIAANDEIVFADNSDSNHIKRSTIKFDGSTATKALTQKGTWETFNNYSLPTANGSTKGGVTLSDATNGTEGVSGGKAATPKAVSDALAAAKTYADTNDSDTWKANSKTSEGYVAAGGSNANKVWKTDASGNPDWRNDADTDTTYTLGTTGSGTTRKVTLTAGGSGSGTQSVDVPDTNTHLPSYADIVFYAGDKSGSVSSEITASAGAELLAVVAGVGLVINGEEGVDPEDTIYIRPNLNSTASKGVIGTTSKLYEVGVDDTGKLCVEVPWTDSNTDTKVTQNNSTANSALPIILSYSNSSSNLTNTVNKNSSLTYNPSTKALVTGGTVNGYTLGAACEKSIGAVADGNTGLVTGDAVYDAIRDVLTTSAALVYHGTIGAAQDSPTITSLPTIYSRGDVYVVKTAGTYAGKDCEVGDMIICNTDNDIASSANNAHWDVIQSNIEPLTNTEIETAWQAGLTANGF